MKELYVEVDRHTAYNNKTYLIGSRNVHCIIIAFLKLDRIFSFIYSVPLQKKKVFYSFSFIRHNFHNTATVY